MAQQRTGWVGWVWFAAIMSVLIGAFNVIDGLVALFQKSLFVVGQNQVLAFNLTTWGWIHLIVGALQVIAGCALFSGKTWARVTVGALVVVNAIAQMAFMPVYPVWSLLVIALDVITLYAVVVHGGEARPEDGGAGYSAGYMAGAGGAWDQGSSGRHEQQGDRTAGQMSEPGAGPGAEMSGQGAQRGPEMARPGAQRDAGMPEQGVQRGAEPRADQAERGEQRATSTTGPADRRVAGPESGAGLTAEPRTDRTGDVPPA
jgi:hypothetical protein